MFGTNELKTSRRCRRGLNWGDAEERGSSVAGPSERGSHDCVVSRRMIPVMCGALRHEEQGRSRPP